MLMGNVVDYTKTYIYKKYSRQVAQKSNFYISKMLRLKSVFLYI